MNSAREYLGRLVQDSRTVELRHASGGQWESGLFDHVDAIEAVVRERSQDGSLYTSLNRPGDLRVTNAMGTRALKDDDISVISRIPFDLDPERPANTPSNDAELQAACQARDLLVRLLAGFGWPSPALGMSGNGAHALYRANVKVSPAWRKGAAIIYSGLRDRLRDPLQALGVRFDVTVRNPSRIWRLYGSTNRKGTPTEDRPHRQTTIVLPAGAWQTVSAEILDRAVQSLTSTVVREQRINRRHGYANFWQTGESLGRGDFATLDVVGWFQAHGAYRRPLSGGKHAVACPWLGEHTTISESGTDSVVWEAGPPVWPTFHCSHSHCDGRSLRDVVELWGDADHFCTREYSCA